jgi:hypothetical protein
MKKLKNTKTLAPWKDLIQTELFKFDGRRVIEKNNEFTKSIWETEITTQAWKQSIVL